MDLPVQLLVIYEASQIPRRVGRYCSFTFNKRSMTDAVAKGEFRVESLEY